MHAQVSHVQPRGQGQCSWRRRTVHHRLHEDAHGSTCRSGNWFSSLNKMIRDFVLSTVTVLVWHRQWHGISDLRSASTYHCSQDVLHSWKSWISTMAPGNYLTVFDCLLLVWPTILQFESSSTFVYWVIDGKHLNVNQDWYDLGLATLPGKCQLKQQWNGCLPMRKHCIFYCIDLLEVIFADLLDNMSWTAHNSAEFVWTLFLTCWS